MRVGNGADERTHAPPEKSFLQLVCVPIRGKIKEMKEKSRAVSHMIHLEAFAYNLPKLS